MTILLLIVILLLILILPLVFKPVEEQIEIFLFIAGIIAVSATGQWSAGLAVEALLDPVKITAAVLAAGFIFMYLYEAIKKGSHWLLNKAGTKAFIFLVVTMLGLVSSMITAIISALVLTEIIKHLKLGRKEEIKLVVISCFSIGMGAVLTPIGEPLSTITIAKLHGAPYHAGFWFLMKNIWWYIIPSIIAMGLAAMNVVGENKELAFDGHKTTASEKETVKDVLTRTVKVYVFIMGLVLLGKGFEPLIAGYISKIPFYFLYWINIISAVLDNATLAAAEISPVMSLLQIKAAVLGLIIAGGMLIPGNIPNIIASGKLKIKSREWAAFALPLGMGLMVMFFIILIVINIFKRV